MLDARQPAVLLKFGMSALLGRKAGRFANMTFVLTVCMAQLREVRNMNCAPNIDTQRIHTHTHTHTHTHAHTNTHTHTHTQTHTHTHTHTCGRPTESTAAHTSPAVVLQKPVTRTGAHQRGETNGAAHLRTGRPTNRARGLEQPNGQNCTLQRQAHPTQSDSRATHSSSIADRRGEGHMRPASWPFFSSPSSLNKLMVRVCRPECPGNQLFGPMPMSTFMSVVSRAIMSSQSTSTGASTASLPGTSDGFSN